MDTPTGPPALTRATLRNAIAEALWFHVSGNELAVVCESFELAAQLGDDDDPIYSKRKYVRRRLLASTREDLIQLARKVHEEFPTTELLSSSARRGIEASTAN